MQGILGIQKCFRGHQARGCFCELKNGVTTLQSCTASIFNIVSFGAKLYKIICTFSSFYKICVVNVFYNDKRNVSEDWLVLSKYNSKTY